MTDPMCAISLIIDQPGLVQYVGNRQWRSYRNSSYSRAAGPGCVGGPPYHECQKL